MFEKHFVVVSSSIGTRGKPAEAIEVKLPLEGSEFRLSEVLRHNLVDKLSWLVNYKATSMWLPI